MDSILDHCRTAPTVEFAPGAFILTEGETTGRLYVLASGQVEVQRAGTQVAVVGETGAVFGEMAILLGRPHTASVKAVTPVTAFVIEDATAFMRANPEIALILARTLAQRLSAATTYLADITRQYAGHTNHLGMVGEVLGTLLHQPRHDGFRPDLEPTDDPRL